MVVADVGEDTLAKGLSLTTATAVEKNVAVAMMERRDRRETPHNMCPEVHPFANYSVRTTVLFLERRYLGSYTNEDSADEGCHGGRRECYSRRILKNGDSKLPLKGMSEDTQ